MKKYEHLSLEERYQIQAFLAMKATYKAIANYLGRDQSTISREIARHQVNGSYQAEKANEQMRLRSINSRNATRISENTWAACEEQLQKDWSPEQIASQLPICPETIYQYVYANRAQGGTLWTHLRRQRKVRRSYLHRQERRGTIKNRRSIHTRPRAIEDRYQVGHWEADTVIGAHHKQAIVTLVERKSGYALIMKVEQKTAALVSEAIIQLLTPIKHMVKTITYDNGKEFADHEKIDNSLGSTGYFADPYSSWQRGSNENFNGLLRQYVPKSSSFEWLSELRLKEIQERINTRPRKRLKFKTPADIFNTSLRRRCTS